ncbi:3'-5' exonuclease [Pseudomaricurvus sp.]|uniref:3'-5' exonuclease n=1 Tax=Pseudomaricurvus sp. TaxID=2004510 RepID=UPI003F6B404D
MSWGFPGLRLQRQLYRLRQRSLSAAQKREFLALSHCWQHMQCRGGDGWREVEFLVVDTETSSLNAATGELVSAGWVVIRGGRVVLSTAEHWLMKPRNSVGESATIHSLRDCELSEGLGEDDLMSRFLQAASGRVLVFHHAPLDLAFLNRISRRLYGAPLLMPVVDTLQVESRSLERRNQPVMNNMLRLASCCARYNLPPARAHNALTDALATAELLLAQVGYKGGSVKLRELL